MNSLRVTILYNEPLDPTDPAEQDVIVQREFVAETLRATGHAVETLGATLDLEAVRRRLTERRPDVVFNLVESLGGTDRLMSLATLLLEGLRIPFTGCRTAAILQTSNKVGAKATLQRANLPTPDWFTADWGDGDAAVSGVSLGPEDDAGRWIVKPIWEHASLGMDDAAVFTASSVQEVIRRVNGRARATGRPHFAEEFIAGREFNLSVLTDARGGPQVLPPAEIDFSAFPPDKPRIVGHAAKWRADSFEYQQTPRTFELPAADSRLVARLTSFAKECWRVFDLRGYARVDFRADDAGQPWILEINANPCLAPDAGFAAALDRAGIKPSDALSRIVGAALAVGD
jgi:D-alanine-D-alanine ligase